MEKTCFSRTSLLLLLMDVELKILQVWIHCVRSDSIITVLRIVYDRSIDRTDRSILKAEVVLSFALGAPSIVVQLSPGFFNDRRTASTTFTYISFLCVSSREGSQYTKRDSCERSRANVSGCVEGLEERF